MPAFNLGQLIEGNLDVAWKPGANAPVDAVGLLLASCAVFFGLVVFVVAWRASRAAPAAAFAGLLIVAALTFAAVVHYGQTDSNPYPAILDSTESLVPTGDVVYVGDTSSIDNRLIWNVNRTRLDLIGVSPDRGQMQLHALPFVRHAIALGQDVWYLQTEANSPADFFDELNSMGLCPSIRPLQSRALLFDWQPCAQ